VLSALAAIAPPKPPPPPTPPPQPQPQPPPPPPTAAERAATEGQMLAGLLGRATEPAHYPPPPAQRARTGSASEPSSAAFAALKAELLELRETVDECETRERLLLQQAAFLKDELRELGRNQGRSQMDVMYLKNIVTKYIETHDLALLPVIAETLHLSPDEVERIRQYRRAGTAGGGIFSRLLS
jgi:hypothetical protein